MPLISIIIPNYNGAEHLETSLRSINQQTFSDYEIIVVDNGSSDNSLSLINTQHQGVIVYRFNENRGFAAAVNHGIKNSKGRYIALLNNDIELDSQWLAKLAEAIECDNELGSVACKMLNYYERTIIDAAGDVLTKAGNTIGRGSGEKDTGQYNVAEYVFGACAGAGLYRREVFEKVGLYDEDYFAWFEDADHSFRSQMTGYKCLYVPSALCYHKRGATAKKMSELSVRLHARNHLYYLIINIPAKMFWNHCLFIIASRIRNWTTIVLQGDGKALLWAFDRIFLELPKILEKRNRVQKSRSVSMSYLRAQCK